MADPTTNSITTTSSITTEDELASSLSTISASLLPSDPDLLQAALDTSLLRLQASYTPRDDTDDTEKVLVAFLEHLPLHGRRVLLAMIDQDSTDDHLFAIAAHLTTTILIPSEYPHCIATYNGIPTS